MARVGINGFGRMGRLAVRAGWQNPDLEFVTLNEPHADALPLRVRSAILRAGAHAAQRVLNGARTPTHRRHDALRSRLTFTERAHRLRPLRLDAPRP